MAYKLKPNYHFADATELGIDKVPVGRTIVIEDYGNYNDIKWFRKVSNTDLDETSTVADAISAGNLEAPLDSKRDILDSYSQTEIDSLSSLKADTADIYTRTEAEATFRTQTDSYSITATDALINEVKTNPTGIFQHANSISSSFTIEDGNNAGSIGPITLENGVSITIPDGSVWEII